MADTFRVRLKKTIPVNSSLGIAAFNTGGTNKQIDILGVTDVRWETSKTLIPIPFLQARYDGTDGSNTMIIDLKNLSEKLTITGWLEDDEAGGDTAWEKAWMLRAMEVVGGPLYSLALGKPSAGTDIIYFNSTTITANLERVSWSYKAHDTEITSQPNVGKIEITLVFTIANTKSL